MLQKAEKCVVSADLKVGLMAAAIALGILAGIAGFIPLFIALRLSRKSGHFDLCRVQKRAS